MAVPLNSHKLWNPNGSIVANSTQIISGQVHEHHVFRTFLFVLKQFSGQCLVSRRIPSEWPCTSDGEAFRVATDLSGQHLWAGPDYFPVAKLEVVHVGRRIDPPKRPIEPEERTLERNLVPLRQNYLENISGFNIVLGLLDSLAEILLANVRLRFTETNLTAISRFLQKFLRFFYPVFFAVEVVRFAAEMVEHDPVFEEAEFYIGETVSFVS